MKLYFMGICGTAMGNSALLLRSAGHEVLGADAGVYPPMSTVLAEAGIAVHEGYDPDRLKALGPDLVVVGNAMSRGNPEVEWLLDSRAIPFRSLPETLGEFVLKRRSNIVVCGTHGKTTATAITAFLLRENGRDPGYLIGGAPVDPPGGGRLGAASDPFVIEGDEYDSAFFDKRSKFIHYAPRIAVLNNLEFDHADIFRDLADVQRAFRHLTRIVPGSGCIVLNGDDGNIAALGAMDWTRVVRVGLGGGNDAQIAGFEESPEGSRFKLTWKGREWADVRWRLPGLYNARNAAVAAVAAGLALYPGEPNRLDISALARFRGVRRRQEVRAGARGLTVIEDFGHHPTALRETLRSFRARHPGARLTAVFEPRSNTARTKALQAGFQDALAEADEVYLGPVSRAERLREEERFDGPAVARALGEKGRIARSFDTSAALLESLSLATLSRRGPERVVVFFSNGSFDGIIGRYAAEVARG
ncbi:MAG: Mur ligase family protein [Opitutaceae bacterium]|jgi:UDP-N-acetylmuramate: L-alanyl-gamma-D-glutamyl-meso-diaminopimelate ligase